MVGSLCGMTDDECTYSCWYLVLKKPMNLSRTSLAVSVVDILFGDDRLFD